MTTPAYDFFRRELLERRRLLETASEAAEDPQLAKLLHDVDAALERMSFGTFGICEVCQGEIEPERLVANPLMCFCLDDLNESGRRALQRDLDLAGQIQSTMLPKKCARFGPWETCYHFEPVGPVSGDYCDLIPVDGSLYFMLGDAAGKGVAASMVMSQLHTLFRALTQQRLRPAELLERANHVLCETSLTGRFATVICGLASDDGKIEIASAGHCPALVLRSNIEFVESTGLPLGMFCEARYTSEQFRLENREGLLLYTDGVVEATDSRDSEYGTARLAQLARRIATSGAEEAVNACVADVTAFRTTANDDLTVMAIQRLAEAGAQHARQVA